MAEITAALVKELRERTGSGMMECKKALLETSGDIEAAVELMRKAGQAKADKKASRVAAEGLIVIRQAGGAAAMVEVNCETDFVAKTEQFQQFAHDVALQIANMAPEYVNREDVPEAVVKAEREIQRRRILEEGKPENVADKIVDGRMNKFFEEIVLTEQIFIKDDSKTIGQLLSETVAGVGESIQIRRFARFALGEDAPGTGE